MYLEGSYLHWLPRGFPGSLGEESCAIHSGGMGAGSPANAVIPCHHSMLVTGKGSCPAAQGLLGL